MPIFKVTAMQEVRTTVALYVEAESEREADLYVAGLSNLEDVPGCVVEDETDMGGSIESVEQVEHAPDGERVIPAKWDGAIAVVPAHDNIQRATGTLPGLGFPALQ
jgi:hypothetical protein